MPWPTAKPPVTTTTAVRQLSMHKVSNGRLWPAIRFLILFRRGFGFSVFWATTDPAVVAETCTNLGGPWTSLATSPLLAGTAAFSDPRWTNYPRRFYRVRSQ